MDVKYFLSYYYYGGNIYTAMKRYSEALYMYEVVVTTPARAVSIIMLEAYKKYILVSLIIHGKVAPLPKYTSQVRINILIRSRAVRNYYHFPEFFPMCFFLFRKGQ